MARLSFLVVLLALGGCATAVPRAAPPRPLQSAPPTMIKAGLESVLGRDARTIEANLGKPDLDVREGTARKLQFSGPACVLDAYLYPPARGGEPVVTYVDARLLDGRDIDRASCVAALVAQRQTR